MKQTLYRKHRPAKFSEIVGQKHITDTLRNAILTRRLAHAYLFSGPRGTGKTTTGRVMASALNCLDERDPAEPCGICENCKAISNGSFMDLVEIDAASNNGVDDVRELREKVAYACVMGQKKVYLIDEVHMMSRSAFNALLKTLEEPPDHVMFLLATTEAEKVPATVLSRCQHFEFHSITFADILAELKRIATLEAQEMDFNGDVSEEALTLIAHAATGGLRDAVSLLDQALTFCGAGLPPDQIRALLGSTDIRTIIDLGEAMTTGDTSRSLNLLDNYFREGGNPGSLAASWLDYSRKLLILSAAPELLKDDDPYFARKDDLLAQATRFKPKSLAALVDSSGDLLNRIRNSEYPEALLDAAWTKWCAAVIAMNNPAETLSDSERKQPVEENPTLHKKAVTTPAIPKEAISSTPLKPIPPVQVNPPRNSEQPAKVHTTVKSDSSSTVESSTVDHKPNILQPETLKQDEPLPESPRKSEQSPLQRIRDLWPVLKEKIKSRNPMIHALIMEAVPVEVNDSVIILNYNPKFSFHCNSLKHKNNKTFLEKTLQEVYGEAYTFDTTISGGSPEPADLVKDDPLVHKALELFGGKIVNVESEEKL